MYSVSLSCPRKKCWSTASCSTATPGRCERPVVDFGVEAVVAEVIEGDIAARGRDFHAAVACAARRAGPRSSRPLRCAPGAGESRIRPAGSRLVPAAEECGADAHAGGAFLDRGLQIVRHSHRELRERRARARAREVCGSRARGASGSSLQGGMVIRPCSFKLGQLRTAAISAGSSAGSTPLLASSAESLTSIMTSSGRPDSFRRRASLARIDGLDRLK